MSTLLPSENTTSPRKLVFLLLGATGGTGKYFLTQALSEGHRVRALIRTPSKLPASVSTNPKLEVIEGSITEPVDTDALVKGVDYIVCMLGDVNAQKRAKINEAFVRRLVPSMRKHGVKRILYQAGGLSKPYGGELSMILWIIRNTIARGFNGQHLDNEAVMAYLATEAKDLEWIVHRAGIISDGPSKGTLERSADNYSMGTHRDCAEYSWRLIMDDAAVRTCDFSCYKK